MRALLTSDWQCDPQNLDLCQKAWSEMLTITDDYRLSTIVLAGDLKASYNPVDLRCVKFWQRAIELAIMRRLKVVIDLGNHDRLGQYDDNQNWFPILRKVGAICVDVEPQVVDGIALLPFTTKTELFRQRAKELAKRMNSDRGILIFHEDIRDGQYNVLGRKSESKITVDDLQPDSYKFCFGGHFHLHQRIAKNAYYIGNPFATDWGEANQKKGYVVLTDGEFEFVPSSIPGWFDPTWPGFWQPKSWNGCHVRVHALCRSANEYLRVSTKMRQDAELKYEGAEIFVAADFDIDANRDTAVNISPSDPDDVKIREYVKETCPAALNKKEVANYLLSKLESVGAKWRRTGVGIRFERAMARNFLSFKELRIDWTEKGLTVVQGKNKDRGGRSNGAGKSSCLSVIPVALFGTTFKGQKHDRWARRNSTDNAIVRLEIRDTQNRKIVIERARRPTRLQLWVDGKDCTIGMKPQQKDATQGEIEKLTGFTWQTMANSVYIDQEIARAFLQGTKAERTKVLSKFQNLERFENALTLVRKDKTDSDALAQKKQTKLSVFEERLSGLKKRLTMLIEASEERTRASWVEVTKKKRLWQQKEQELSHRINKLNLQSKELESRATKLQKWLTGLEHQLSKRQQYQRMKELEIEKLSAAMQQSQCPTCWQDVDKDILRQVGIKVKNAIRKVKESIAEKQDEITNYRLKNQRVEGDYDLVTVKVGKLESIVRTAKLVYDEAYEAHRQLRDQEHMASGLQKATEDELQKTTDTVDRLRVELQELAKEKDFYEYCEKAMSRDGIPSFLNALLCPALNGAATFYSELFGDKAIQVRFEIENGDFVPRVLNATGGESIDDQSQGEAALAGLIASFALRDITPKCNLLVLDEPCVGMDEASCRQFSTAMKVLNETKFPSIWMITHNPAILQELENQRAITVIKSRGVSSLEQS